MAAALSGCIVVEQGAPRRDAGSDAASVPNDGAAGDGSAKPDGSNSSTCTVKSTEARGATAVEVVIPTGASWTTPNNASATDGVIAACALKAASPRSDTLLIGAFGFNLPSTAKVTGVEFKVTRRNANARVRDADAKLWLRGSAYADRGGSTPWTNVLTPETYGGPTDTWNATLVGSDVNDKSFALGFAAAIPSDGISDDALLDGVTAKIYYCD